MLIDYFEKLYDKGYNSFLCDLDERLKSEIKTFVVTANPETLMIGNSNLEFDNILKKESTIIVPDGIGVVKAAKVLGISINERITGVDVVSHLLNSANEKEKSVYLVGAKEEVVSTLIKKIEVEYPKIRILGYSNGYVKDKDAVFENIIKLEPDIILVALGIPEQEILINKYYERFTKGIMIGVGGSFDVLSGIKKRAPKIFIKLNLEWLYRIAKEPKRIKRFYTSNIKFISQIKKLKR